MSWLTPSIKQRLVGALVLLGLTAAFLPMLFARKNEPRVVSVEAPAMPTPPANLAVKPSSTAPPSSTQDSANTPLPVQGHLDGVGIPIAWSVQVVALSSEAQAQEFQQRLRQQGYNAYVRVFSNGYAVLIGPVLHESDAKQLAASIAKQWQVNPLVTRFQPE